MKFIKQNLVNLEPRKSRYIVIDDALNNFGIKVYPSGIKAYIIKIKSNGKVKEYTISECQSMSRTEISKARKEAEVLIEQYKQGIDVKEKEKNQIVKNKSLAKCIDDYLLTIKKGTHKSVNEARLIWDKAGWLNKPLRNISPLMILKLYDKRVKISFHGARQEAAYLRAIWNQNKKELSLGDSPTLILNEERKGWNKKTTNNRRLDFETASRWYQALNEIPTRDKNLFMLIYFSGLRASEAMNLDWKSINLENNSLHLSDTKNGKPLDIPLNSHALGVLQSVLDGEYKHKKYVFPQVNKAGDVEPMKYYSKSTGKLKKQGVLWSPHDSRRGFITCADFIGVSHYMAKQLTNHVIDQDIHGGYIHYTIAEMREASQKIGDALNKQLHSSNVVEFKKKA